MILCNLLDKRPLVWPSITEDGVTRLKEYVELTPAEAIQADCDIKAINIILQGLPTEILCFLWSTYAIGRQFSSEHQYLHTTNVDQLHAHLQQHERHAIEVRLMHERNPDPLALVASHQLTQPTYQSHLHPHQQSLSQQHVSPYQSSQFLTPYQHHQYSTPLSSTYPTNEYQSTVHHNVYSQQPSIPQLEYAPTTYQQQQPEFSQPDSSLVVPVFQKGDDPIDAINHMMSFLTAVVTSRYPTTNNQLRTSSNPRQQATIYDGKVTVQPVQGRHTSYAAGTTRKYTSGASGSNTGKPRTVICYNCKGEGHIDGNGSTCGSTELAVLIISMAPVCYQKWHRTDLKKNVYDLRFNRGGVGSNFGVGEGKEEFMGGIGGGSFAKRLMVAEDDLGGDGFIVDGGRSPSPSSKDGEDGGVENKSSMGSRLIVPVRGSSMDE
ncbi:hypothetical protein Tco_1092927 [Tanacetum coccineum]|uniref:CCHC-type domain-containing protein n=1 Tax=Tanacetum coccineum TaxID=301880 RepID=A0ABQ5ICI2_9ASTR